jgi:ParB/RepB/Spo0J family partition protein
MNEIAVKSIAAVSNRKHGGNGDIQILAESIKRYGLIQPVVVKPDGKTTYRLVAGRRRFEAVQSLDWETIPAVVLPKDTEDTDAIALAENVNRMDMHPLDEAAHFKKLHDAGMTVDEIARYYDRSSSAIYHRIRLNNLIDDLKTMFRVGNFTLTGASVLAGLSHEQQEAFLDQFDGVEKIEQFAIASFIRNLQQKRYVYLINAEKCKDCKTRTCYKGNTLFEEFADFDDVCLDTLCFTERLKEKITTAVEIMSMSEKTDIKTVVLPSDVAAYFDQYAGSITVDGVSMPMMTKDKLKQVFEQYAAYTAYCFPAWRIYMLNSGKIEVRIEYFMDKDGLKRMAEDESAKAGTEAGQDEEAEEEDGGDAAEGEPETAVRRSVFDTVHSIITVPEEQAEAVAVALEKKYGNKYSLEQAVRAEVLRTTVRLNRVRPVNSEQDNRFLNVFFREIFPAIDTPEQEHIYWEFTGEQWTGDYERISRLPFVGLCTLWMALSMSPFHVPSFNKFSELEAEDFDKDCYLVFTGLSPKKFKDLYRKTLEELVEEALSETDEDETFVEEE